MSITFSPASEAIGVEVRGLPSDARVSEDEFQRLKQAWLEHCILVLRDLDLAPEDQVAFTRRFGPH